MKVENKLYKTEKNKSRSNLFLSLIVLSTLTLAMSCGSDEEDGGFSIQNFETTIDENPDAGTSLGTIQGNVQGLDVVYGLTSEAPEGAFDINVTTGELTVADASLFDFETNPKLTATAVATAGQETATATVTVNLTDVASELNVGENGLIARYTFDNTLADAQGNFPDFEFAGEGSDPRSVLDRDGNTQRAYIIENGSKYLRLPNQELLVDTDKTFTISIWIYPQDTRQQMRPVIYKDYDYQLQVSPGEFVNGTNFFSAVNQGTPSDDENTWGTNSRISQLSAPRRVRWSHLAMVCDSDEVRVYVNGTEVYDAEISVPSFKNSGGDIFIGAILDENGTVSQKNIITVDDFRYYNQALTESQVRELAEVSNGIQ